MRRFLYAGLSIFLLLAGCGGGGTAGGSGRDLNLALDETPDGKHAGIYLASARAYDKALGVTLRIGREPPDLRLVGVAAMDPEQTVAVMAIQPGDLYLATDRVTLDERRDDVRAAVEAIQRGYEESLVDPESAVSIMVDAEGLDRQRLAEQLEAASPTFKRGERDFGVIDPQALSPGTFDDSLVSPSDR